MKPSLAALLTASACILGGGVAGAQLRQGFGGPQGFGEPCRGLAPCDDCSSAPIDLAALFGGGLCVGDNPDGGAPARHQTAFVNNNGNISFGAPFRGFLARPFPFASAPLVAPFWADVDTSPGGAPARNAVFCHTAPGLFVVTWFAVGYRGATNGRANTFQAVLEREGTCSAGDLTVSFHYGQCEWTSADTAGGDGGLGGFEAIAGIDLGNGIDGYVVPSRPPATACGVLAGDSNVGVPGTWRFEVRGCEVTGRCEGAGAPCATGLPGRCAVGVTRCSDSSDAGVSCRAATLPTAERCNGEDDDCNGRVDDGDTNCPAGTVCGGGRCVEPCRPELGCAGNLSCDDTTGLCVTPACRGVRCAPDQRCDLGACVAGCDRVVCPMGQACRAGRCVDPCEGVSCGTNERCVAQSAGGGLRGACVARCPCRRCPTGQTCQNGDCIPVRCVGVSCPVGESCQDGRCVDRCAGASCPGAARCSAGTCLDPPGTDGGVSDAGSVAARDASADTGGPAGGRLSVTRSGCGCRTPPARAARWPHLAWLLGVLLGRRAGRWRGR